jgi:hypothetical protein
MPLVGAWLYSDLTGPVKSRIIAPWRGRVGSHRANGVGAKRRPMIYPAKCETAEIAGYIRRELCANAFRLILDNLSVFLAVPQRAGDIRSR